MISENDLEYLVTCSREENRVLSVDANVPDSTVRVSDMAKELLTLRKEKKELEQKYKNATTYCEKHTDFEGYCCVVCLLEDRDNLRREKQLLIENSERLAGELMWCSGSLDFSPEGIAHEGFINGIVPALDKHEALMKQVKGE